MEFGTVSILLCLCLTVSSTQGRNFTAIRWTEIPTSGYSFKEKQTTIRESCRYNCGYNLGICSCSSSCSYYGNCCPDYYYYCRATSAYPTTVYGSCGGYLSNPSGKFSSPNYPYNYFNNEYCTWQITVASAQRIVLAFTDIQLELNCCGCDTLSVYDGRSTSSRPLASFCQGNGRGIPIRSSSNNMLVVFRTDSSITGRGFKAVYNTGQFSCRYNCGYSVGDCSCGSSCQSRGDCCPDFCDYCSLNNYDYCYKSTAETTTTLPVSNSTIRESCRYNCGYNLGICSCSSSCSYYGNCCPDYYYYCGTTTSYPSSTTTGQPFCGGHLNASGSFSSPFHPGNYPNYANCIWHLTAVPGQEVFLTFDDLGLEACCSCDYIAVYDGPSTTYRLLGKLCFNSTLGTFRSSSGSMTVLFRSDGSVTSRGFTASFSSSLPQYQGRVDCSSGRIKVAIQSSYLASLGLSGRELRLNDLKCRPQVFYSEVVFTFPVNTCGTRRKFANGRVLYTNDVWAYGSQLGEITRQNALHLHVACYMEQETTARIMYEARNTSANITGTGSFNVTMTFYTSSNFYTPVYDSPYVVSLIQNLYVQVQLLGDTSSLVIFLDTCVASPSPYDFVTRSYDLLRNGCVKDSTYYSYSSGYSYLARFRFQAFRFLRSHSSVYLQCRVVVCTASSSYSRCSQGCLSRRARSLGSAPSHGEATMVLGPIQLKDLKDPQKMPVVEDVI